VAEPRRTDVLVNTTAVGLNGSADDLPLRDSLDPELVADLVYGSSDPPVTAWARARGARITDGLDVLLHQGALSFVRWTGKDAPVDRMREAIRRSGRAPVMRLRFRH
jgi:shikimate dehydrogenase